MHWGGASNLSVHAFHLAGKRRIIAISITVASLIAVATLTAALVIGTRTAHGNPVSSGLCSPNAPVCTINGNGAYADFSSVSTDGCITTDVAIESTGSFTNPGHTTDNFALVFISKYDQCNNVQLELGANFDPVTGQADFTGTSNYGANLTSATVIGTAPLYDVNTGALLFTTNIDVTWQRNSAVTHNNDVEIFHSPTINVTTNIQGSSAPAMASGSFNDETGANAATLPTANAALFDSHGSQVIITKP